MKIKLFKKLAAFLSAGIIGSTMMTSSFAFAKSLTFSLREGTNKDFVIPFTINKMHISEEKFKKGSPQLIVSLYPTRKSILL